jgi:dolichol-phosphate mannosyltransferase
MGSKINLSIIIPVFNEEENIKKLFFKLENQLKKINKIKKYEIIFVNDGSTDNTLNKIKDLKSKLIKIVSFPKNRGKSYALWSGFKKAKFDWLLTLDGDLQDNPEDIARLISKIEEGFDCVCGRRVKRSDNLLKKISTKIANSVHNLILKDNFKDLVSPLKLIKTKAAKNLPFFDGAHRFIPILLKSKSYRVAEIDVIQNPRYKGKSKYGLFNRVFKTSRDLFKVRKIINKR